MMEPEDQVTPRPPLIGIALVSIVGVVLVGALVYLASDRWSDGSTSFAAEPGSGARRDGGGGSAEAETLATIREHRAAELEAERSSAAVQARLEVNRLLTRADGVDELVADLDEELALWSGQLEAALTNDAGKRLAASEAATRSFAAVWNREGRPTTRDVQALRGRVGTIRTELDAVLASEPVAFPGATRAILRQSLEQEEAAARTMLERLQKDRKALEALLVNARETPPAATTLEATMTALEQQDAADELAATIAREDAERADREAREQEHLDEQARLRQRAEDPEVQKLYSAFITTGKYSPKADVHAAKNAFVPPKGVSVSDLRDWNVLSNVEHFQAFARGKRTARGHMFDLNDRTPLTEPEPKTSEEWDVWEQRMAEFSTLVPVFREMGLLEP